MSAIKEYYQENKENQKWKRKKAIYKKRKIILTLSIGKEKHLTYGEKFA